MLKMIVIGCPGAGKSVFARKLKEATGIPLYYLDMLWHKPDGTNISGEEFENRLNEIMQKDSWIIDGNYQRTLESRLRECDTVFLMDFPLEVCLAGAKSRIGTAREDLPWIETEFDEEFKQWIVDFPKNQLPQLYELVDKYRENKNIVIFKSRKEADEYLETLPQKNVIMENTPTIKTKRLILRKFMESDLAAYFDMMSDKSTNQYLPWFPVKTMCEAKELLHKNCMDAYGLACAYRYAICLKEDNIPIGYCGFSGTQSNDIGYGLKSEFWHRGIITEAVMAMVERIKNAGYSYITATHDVNNPRSGEVMKKLGMRYRYSYVEKWQPKNITVTFRMYQLNFDGSNENTYMEYWNRYENHFI